LADNLNLPPSISGDGRTFVSALKKILSNVVNVITDTIEPIVNPLINTNTPTAPTNFTVEFSRDGALWRWDYSDNINIDFFELREDANPGNELRLLYRTRTTQANVVPSVRSGTVYLYARWLNGRYSNPITIQYNKAIPAFPTNVTIEKVFQGFVISCDPIPDDCSGITFRINGEDFFSQNNSFTYNATMGDFVAKVAYKDIFGNGVFSDENTTSIVEVVPPGLVHISGTTVFDDGVIVARMIGDQQVVGTKIKDGEITTDKIGANQITGVHIVGNAVTGDHIEAGSEIRTPVLIGGTIKGARIQNTNNTAYIDSDGTVSGVNIIGSTVSGVAVSGSTINGGTIIGTRIQNETNTAYIDSNGNINGSTITGSTIISPTINGGTIIGGRIQNATNTAYIDSDGNIHGVNITGSTLDSSSITSAGFTVHASAVIRGTISHGQVIPLPAGYTESQCIWGVNPGAGYMSGGNSDRIARFKYLQREDGIVSIFISIGVSVTVLGPDGISSGYGSGSGSDSDTYYRYNLVDGGSGEYWVLGVK